MKEPIKLEHEMNPMLPKENLGEQGDNVLVPKTNFNKRNR